MQRRAAIGSGLGGEVDGGITGRLGSGDGGGRGRGGEVNRGVGSGLGGEVDGGITGRLGSGGGGGRGRGVDLDRGVGSGLGGEVDGGIAHGGAGSGITAAIRLLVVGSVHRCSSNNRALRPVLPALGPRGGGIPLHAADLPHSGVKSDYRGPGRTSPAAVPKTSRPPPECICGDTTAVEGGRRIPPPPARVEGVASRRP